MNATHEPATEVQLTYLRQHGVQPEEGLSRAEAIELIRKLGLRSVERACAQIATPHALREAILRAEVAVARATLPGLSAAEAALRKAKADRERFWLDTCLGTTALDHCTDLVHELYRKLGCLYCCPTERQAQDVLSALDGALPFWDRDHPELFYQTLGLNFPELKHP